MADSQYRQIQLISIVLMCVALLVTSIYFAEKEGVFVVREIKVSAVKENFAYWRDLQTALDIDLEKFAGVNIWQLDIAGIEKVVQKHDWIEDYQLNRRLPNRIGISLLPKKVIAVYVSNKGKATPMSSDGRFLPRVELSKAPIAPVMRNAKVVKNPAVRIKVKKILNRLPGDGPFSIDKVAEIEVDKSGNVWLEMLRNKIKVRIGDQNIPVKVARVAEVLEYLESQGIEERVIDAEFSQKVLVRPRKQ